MRRAAPGSFEKLYRRGGCVFLDCDGVIFDSNAFKIDALRATIARETDAAQREMLRYWRASGGISRYVKLAHFYRNIVGADDVQARVNEAAQVFSAHSRAGYRTVEPVAEALRLARDAGSERCFVISGTDQEELRDVFREHGIADLFADVLGSPATKPEHIERLLAATRCAPSDAIFIGDGAGDFRACETMGVVFVYLAQMSEWEDAEETLADCDAVVARDWRELLAALGIV